MGRVGFLTGSALVAAVWTVAVGAAIAVPTAAEGASQGKAALAARLLRLDPGARVGGNTQVSTAAGALVLGVAHRPNFIMGLGSHQRIVGGTGHDELGARGSGTLVQGGRGNDLIHGMQGSQRLEGGPGNDQIFGGRGRDRLEGGPGDDRMVDKQGSTIVVSGRGENWVDVADGVGDDRVLCAVGSTNHIRADRGDRLDPRCHRRPSSVRYLSTKQVRRNARASDDLVQSSPPLAHVSDCVPGPDCPLTGIGTNYDPYVQPCDAPYPAACTVTFASRSLSGLWANEYVPAYGCPPTDPVFNATNYAPGGTALPLGVQVNGLGNIGVSITGTQGFTYRPAPFQGPYDAASTATGGDNSSATNWTIGTNSYQVVLHCA